MKHSLRIHNTEIFIIKKIKEILSVPLFEAAGC